MSRESNGRTELWDVHVEFPAAGRLFGLVELEKQLGECREIRFVPRSYRRAGSFAAVLTYSSRHEAEQVACSALAHGGERFVGPFPRRPPVLVSI